MSRLFVLVAALWTSSLAWAEESLWLAKDAESVRFAGETTPGPKFSSGTRVTVLTREGELVRVFVGDRYGWVASSALTDQAPKDAAPAMPGGLQGMPGGLQEIKLTPDGAGNLIPAVPSPVPGGAPPAPKKP